jgi:hypothetical protein
MFKGLMRWLNRGEIYLQNAKAQLTETGKVTIPRDALREADLFENDLVYVVEIVTTAELGVDGGFEINSYPKIDLVPINNVVKIRG